jgi:hypothetical protein
MKGTAARGAWGIELVDSSREQETKSEVNAYLGNLSKIIARPCGQSHHNPCLCSRLWCKFPRIPAVEITRE